MGRQSKSGSVWTEKGKGGNPYVRMKTHVSSPTKSKMTGVQPPATAEHDHELECKKDGLEGIKHSGMIKGGEVDGIPRTKGMDSAASTRKRVPTFWNVLPFDAGTFSAMESSVPTKSKSPGRTGGEWSKKETRWDE
jgi:hypothetical protein